MANRHSLGVAACTLALAVSCLAGAVPAAAAPSAAFPTSVSVAAAPSNSPLPSATEVESAKSDKAATNEMISRLEASLDSSRVELQRVETAALEAQESLLTAAEERDLRSAEADKAVEQVEYAQQYLAQSRNDLGAVASDMYRNGASNSSLGILLQDDESNDLFYKAATMSALSENRSQTVSTATEAEALVSAWEEYADTAQKAAKAAAENYDAAATKASSTLTTYESAIAPQKELRDELVGHLAFLKEQEEEVVRKQIAEAEEQAQEKALQEVVEAPAAEKPVTKDDLATMQPLAIEAPQELEFIDSEEATPKPLTPKVIEVEKDEPKAPEKPKQTEAPKAPEKPKETQAPKAPEKPKQTETPKAPEKPKATPKAPEKPKTTPKETEKPKVLPQAPEKPKVIEEPKPKPKPKPEPKKVQPKAPEKPKATPKPSPKPEVKKEEPKQEQSNNSNYSAAISWALQTAKDPSKRYVFGGNGPNVFDCSSFSQTAFAKSGISLPRTSSQQFASAPQYVSLSQLRPGDLVFSSSNGGASFYHVAIYIGNGQVVHARNPNAGITVTPLSWVNNMYPKAARY
ncbi:NlpC/P60 family protein [Glutamicibacter sp. AOP38-B1-38]|uniref:NlpC/P60 family protein n=1 Tax=Glutamicibacter sp. AOP38-B1-38 TaxID=3457680 RepID=UPI0040338E10